MTVSVRVSKLFHKQSHVCKDGVLTVTERGVTVNEIVEFDSMDEADEWAHQVNLRYQINDWHVTNLWVDDQNWICLDISEIWDWADAQLGSFRDDYRKHNPREWE